MKVGLKKISTLCFSLLVGWIFLYHTPKMGVAGLVTSWSYPNNADCEDARYNFSELNQDQGYWVSPWCFERR